MDNYTVSYPGLTQMTGNVSGTIVRGTSPGQFTIEVAKNNAALVGIGDLAFLENGSPLFTMRDCALIDITWNGGGEGATANLTFHDRRWRWVKGGGFVSGAFNVRRGDNTIDPETTKTLTELLTMIFDAMGETIVDLSSLPTVEDVVEVQWDHVRSKDALDGLLSTYGLDVVLRMDGTNSVRIVRLGDTGGSLPTTGVRSVQGKSAGLAVPEEITVIGAPARWEQMLELEPVGLDLDGKWKHVNALSYAPAGGWGDIDPDYMLGLAEDVPAEEKKRRKLARDTVFRCYRVVGAADAAFAIEEGDDPIPFNGNPESWQYVLGSTLFEAVSNGDGTLTHKPAELRGVFWDMEYGLENTAPNTLFDGGFSVDAANRLVRCGRPLYAFKADGSGIEFATLFLKTTFSLLGDTRVPVRYGKTRTIGSNGSGAHIRQFQDVESQVTVTSTWSVANERYERDSETTNLTEADLVADYYLDAIEREMVPVDGETRPLAGFHAIELDAEIAQVSYSLTAKMAYTTASKNTEHPSQLPYAKERDIRARADAQKVQGAIQKIAGIVGRGE